MSTVRDASLFSEIPSPAATTLDNDAASTDHGREFDPADAMRMGVSTSLQHVLRQSALADPAGADDRDDAMRIDQAGDDATLVVPPDQGSLRSTGSSWT